MYNSTFYLFGVKPEQLEGLEFFEAIEFLAKEGTNLYNKLYNKIRTKDEDIQMHYVWKAKGLMEFKLNERYAG